MDKSLTGNRQTQTIEVVVPDGMEFVRYDWVVNEGEYYGAWNGYPLLPTSERFWLHAGDSIGLAHRTAIFRKTWTYPEWLGGAGVGMVEDGKWFCFSDKADWQYLVDKAAGKKVLRFPVSAQPLPYFTSFTPPPCDDWRKSWHPNPRA